MDMFRSLLVLLLISVSANFAQAQSQKGFMINPYRTTWLPHDIRETSSLGANLFRYYIYYPEGAVPGTWTPTQYKEFLAAHIYQIDNILPIVQQQGAQLVIDLHTPPCGFQGRYFKMFSDLNCLGQFYEAWDILSKHYAYDPRVASYDLLNEPATKDYKFLNAIYRTATWVVRQNDPNRIVIVESAFGNPLLVNKLEHGLYNTWYSAHVYCAGNSSSISMIDKIVSFKRKYNEPFYVGEIGCETYKKNAAKFIDKALAKFRQHNISWTYHAWAEAPMWEPRGTSVFPVLQKYLAQ